jgi:hypothetical protein
MPTSPVSRLSGYGRQATLADDAPT